MNDELIPSSSERICPECGREFTPTSQWAYKISTKGKYIYLCRYNCHRAAERRLESKVRGKKEMVMRKDMPEKEVLEADLMSNMTIKQLATKYDCSPPTVSKWINVYGLQGVKSGADPAVGTLAGRPALSMTSGVTVMHGEVIFQPAPAEIEQFHTDDPVQELPKVEMEGPRIVCPTCFLDSDHCPGRHINGMTEEGHDRVMSMVEAALVESGIELTWSQEEWESGINEKQEGEPEPQAEGKPKIEFACFGAYDSDYRGCNTDICKMSKECAKVTIPLSIAPPAEPFAEVWQDVRDDITTLRRCYHKQADDDFRSHLLELVREVMGGSASGGRSLGGSSSEGSDLVE